MSDLTFVQYDTAPAVFGTLKRSGVVINLTGATVKFQMRPSSSLKFTVDAAAEVLVAANGTVKYAWGPLDLRMPGDYISRWQVTHFDGTIEHSEPENTITIDPT